MLQYVCNYLEVPVLLGHHTPESSWSGGGDGGGG